METTRAIAPEIDRLVLGINSETARLRGQEVQRAAEEVGLEGPGLLIQFADFLSGGELTPGLAVHRFPYLQEGAVETFMADLASRHLLHVAPSGSYAPAAELGRLLEIILSTRSATAHEMWSAHHDHADEAFGLSSAAMAAIDDRYPTAAAHGRLDPPDETCMRLHHRLVTLRYVRAQAHIDAWRTRGLSAREMVAMTAMWHGEAPGDTEAVEVLRRRGSVDADTETLSPEGVAEREAIEAATNSGAAPVFDAMGDGGSVLVEILVQLPI